MFCRPIKSVVGKFPGKSGICYICGEISVFEYIHSCGYNFHTDCLSNCVLHGPGDDISESKLKCPFCRKFLSFKPPVVKGDCKVYFSLTEIKKKYPNLQYALCDTCMKPFRKETGGCEGSDTVHITKCDECNPTKAPIIKCPKCGFGFEHIYGCPDFSCCRYGYEVCKRNGKSCNHGNTSSVKLCGHRWKIEDTLYRRIMETRESPPSATLVQPILERPPTVREVTEEIWQRSRVRRIAMEHLQESTRIFESSDLPETIEE